MIEKPVVPVPSRARKEKGLKDRFNTRSLFLRQLAQFGVGLHPNGDVLVRFNHRVINR